MLWKGSHYRKRRLLAPCALPCTLPAVTFSVAAAAATRPSLLVLETRLHPSGSRCASSHALCCSRIRSVRLRHLPHGYRVCVAAGQLTVVWTMCCLAEMLGRRQCVWASLGLLLLVLAASTSPSYARRSKYNTLPSYCLCISWHQSPSFVCVLG